jgi:hypothetical protein
MREPYLPLFTSVVRSSLWSLPGDCIKVFFTICAEADPEGCFSGCADGIRRIADLSLADTLKHIATLEAPDEQSKDKTRDATADGRRIERVPNGWRVLNLEWYRKEAQKQAELARKRRWWNEQGSAARRAARRTETETDLDSSYSSRSSPDFPDSDAREPEGPELQQAKPRGRTPGARGVPVFEFPPDWKPTKAHQQLGRELGLTDEDILQRAFHCKNKTYEHPFTDPDRQFNRELAWAKTEKETATHKKELHERRATRSETPGATRSPNDKRPPPVFGGKRSG